MGLFRRQSTLDPAELDRMKADLASLREALERHDRSARQLHDAVGTLDGRVTAVSTELANQLTELGHDIDGTHEGQVKLANEQARYQIAFREDLARLAEETKRAR